VTEVVLVHGSTQGPSGWDRFAAALWTRGHRVQSVDLGTAQSTATLAEAVEQAAGQIGLSDSPVVVAHLAGGLALPALGARLGAGHLVWVHAAIAAEHTAFLDEVTANTTAVFNPEWIGQDPTADPVLATYFLFHDCDLATLRWALTTRRASLPGSLYTTPPGPLPHDTGRTVIVTRDDRTLRPGWLRRAARDRLDADVVEVPGGHCPNVSRPAELADALNSVLTAADPDR